MNVRSKNALLIRTLSSRISKYKKEYKYFKDENLTFRLKDNLQQSKRLLQFYNTIDNLTNQDNKDWNSSVLWKGVCQYGFNCSFKDDQLITFYEVNSLHNLTPPLLRKDLEKLCYQNQAQEAKCQKQQDKIEYDWVKNPQLNNKILQQIGQTPINLQEQEKVEKICQFFIECVSNQSVLSLGNKNYIPKSIDKIAQSCMVKGQNCKLQTNFKNDFKSIQWNLNDSNLTNAILQDQSNILVQDKLNKFCMKGYQCQVDYPQAIISYPKNYETPADPLQKYQKRKLNQIILQCMQHKLDCEYNKKQVKLKNDQMQTMLSQLVQSINPTADTQNMSSDQKKQILQPFFDIQQGAIKSSISSKPLYMKKAQPNNHYLPRQTILGNPLPAAVNECPFIQGNQNVLKIYQYCKQLKTYRCYISYDQKGNMVLSFPEDDQQLPKKLYKAASGQQAAQGLSTQQSVYPYLQKNKLEGYNFDNYYSIQSLDDKKIRINSLDELRQIAASANFIPIQSQQYKKVQIDSSGQNFDKFAKIIKQNITAQDGLTDKQILQQYLDLKRFNYSFQDPKYIIYPQGLQCNDTFNQSTTKQDIVLQKSNQQIERIEQICQRQKCITKVGSDGYQQIQIPNDEDLINKLYEDATGSDNIQEGRDKVQDFCDISRFKCDKSKDGQVIKIRPLTSDQVKLQKNDLVLAAANKQGLPVITNDQGIEVDPKNQNFGKFVDKLYQDDLNAPQFQGQDPQQKLQHYCKQQQYKCQNNEDGNMLILPQGKSNKVFGIQPKANNQKEQEKTEEKEEPIQQNQQGIPGWLWGLLGALLLGILLLSGYLCYRFCQQKQRSKYQKQNEFKLGYIQNLNQGKQVQKSPNHIDQQSLHKKYQSPKPDNKYNQPLVQSKPLQPPNMVRQQPWKNISTKPEYKYNQPLVQSKPQLASNVVRQQPWKTISTKPEYKYNQPFVQSKPQLASNVVRQQPWKTMVNPVQSQQTSNLYKVNQIHSQNMPSKNYKYKSNFSPANQFNQSVNQYNQNTNKNVQEEKIIMCNYYSRQGDRTKIVSGANQYEIRNGYLIQQVREKGFTEKRESKILNISQQNVILQGQTYVQARVILDSGRVLQFLRKP